MAKILVVGSGGREHAIALKFAESKQVDKVFVAPGNPWMESLNNQLKTRIEAVAIDALDTQALVAFAKDERIDVTFVGPETSLAKGLVDAFREADLKIVGPTQIAAQLESSKDFAKQKMMRAGVPTAAFASFKASDFQSAKEYLDTLNQTTFVIKEDGLAAGKGVYIIDNLAEVQETLQHVMSELGSDVVIEEFMEGEELSFFALVNEAHIIPLVIAQDYKRAYDNDQGPNTGGMGSISPVPGYDEENLMQELVDVIVRPLANLMVEDGQPFTGVLYSGLMMTAEGPKVVEFNTRFGDPETQVILPRIQNDFYELILAHLNKERVDIELDQAYSMGVIRAAEGYPKAYSKGMPIHIKSEEIVENIRFAGVTMNEANELQANGGRILMVIDRDASLSQVRRKVYEKMEQIQIEDSFYRRDIAARFEKEGE